jgi:hypothetical protein
VSTAHCGIGPTVPPEKTILPVLTSSCWAFHDIPNIAKGCMTLPLLIAAYGAGGSGTNGPSNDMVGVFLTQKVRRQSGAQGLHGHCRPGDRMITRRFGGK